MPNPEHGDSAKLEAIEKEAARWLARLHSGDIQDADRARLEHWLAEDPRHRTAFDQAEHCWRQLEGLKHRPIVQNTLKNHTRPEPVADKSRRSDRFPIRRRSLAFNAAASFFLVAILFYAYPRWTIWNADYRTETGEIRSLSLADTSTVVLNTATALDQSFSRVERRLEIIEGEAYFQVAKDPSRPFIVAAGSIQIRALGTEFAVRSEENTIHVTVTEHRVEITGPNSPARVVEAGQQLRIPLDSTGESLATADTDRSLAWRQGRLIFESATLEQVAQELNRYRPGLVLVLGEDAAKKRVSGVFEINDLDRVLRVIQSTLQLQSWSIGDRVLVLYG